MPDDTFIRAAAVPEAIKVFVAGANNADESTILPGYANHAGPIVIEEPS